MEIKGEYRIAAPREKVFAALNDQAVLQACIPGCESLEKTSDTEMKAKVRMRIGPVSASFSGKVTLSDIDPPNGYRISGEGQGGAAGFAKGGAVVDAARGRRRNAAELQCRRPGRRQDRPGRCPPDRRHGQEAGRRVLRQVRHHGRGPAAGRGGSRDAVGCAARARHGFSAVTTARCSAARLPALAGHWRRRSRSDPDFPCEPLAATAVGRGQSVVIRNSLDRRMSGLRESFKRPVGVHWRACAETNNVRETNT